MNINIIKLNANDRENNLIDKLAYNLALNDIFLKENVIDSPFSLFFILSGGVEGTFKELMSKYSPPYYIVSINENNALAASMEICTYLNQLNIKHYLFINEETLIDEITSLALSYNAKKIMNGLRLGVIGGLSSWLISSNIDYTEVKNKFGIEIIDININEIYQFIQKPLDIKYPSDYDKLTQKNPFNEKLLYDAIVVYNSLKYIVKKYNLYGLTIKCFDLIKKYKISACLALSLLNDEGIVSACEGDIPTLLTMVLVRCLTSKESFMANLSHIDFQNNECVFAHCTIPRRMCLDYSLDHHFETNESIALKGELDLKPISVIKLSPKLNKMRIISGHIVSNLNENCYCKTQIKVKLDIDMKQFIDSEYANHSVIIYGKYENLFNKFSSLFL